MKKIYLLIIVTFICQTIGVNAQGPNWLWAQNPIGTDQDEGYSVATDNNGNVLVTGAFVSDTITFGTTTLTNNSLVGLRDMFIIKYDASGNVLWAHSAGSNNEDYGRSVTTDGNGNVIVTGEFISTITFGAITLTGTNREFFIVKFDPAGNVLWAKSAGTVSTDIGVSVATDASGNILATGTIDGNSITFGSITLSNPAGNQSIFLVKYDASGNALWGKLIANTAFIGSPSVAVDGNGNVLLMGNYDVSLSFGTTTINSFGGQDIFIVKYSASGGVIWAKSIGGASADGAPYVATDGSGNILVTGHFHSPTIIFGSTTLYFTSAGGAFNDIFIVKYDASGNALWAKSAGDSSVVKVYGIATDANGNILLTGHYYNATITFGTITLPHLTQQKIFIVKYNPAGNELWAKCVNGSGDISPRSIATDNIRNIILTGNFFYAANFGTFALNETTTGYGDIFIAKLDSTDCSAFYTLYADTIPHNWIAVNQASGTPPLTYLWNWGDGNTSSGATPSHTYNNPGYYNICLAITDAAGCNNTYCDSSTYLFRGSEKFHNGSDLNVISPLGINSPATDESLLNIYPNPTTDYLTIALKENNKEVNLTITDITGKIIYANILSEAQNIVLNTGNFSNGMYLVQIQTAGFLVTKKFIINK